MMISIEKLHKIFSDKVAILFGSGPSHLRFVAPKQENEVWFGINYTFEKIDDIDFLFVQDYETYHDIKNKYGGKFILPDVSGLVQRLGTKRMQVYNPEAYGYEIQDPMLNRHSDLANKDYSLEKDVRFFSYTGTSQTAIHILAYMGFKDIMLIGFDYKAFDNGLMHGFTTNKDYSEQKINTLIRLKEGDEYIIDELKRRHKINILNLSGEI